VEFLHAPPGFVLGVQENLKYPATTIRLNPGETLLLYTDGVTEAENKDRELFSNERLKASMSVLRDRELQELVTDARQDISRYTQGQQQSDDITLLALRYKGTTNGV
jgi:sigma-B regulation protein RsbU (phosphoserine phosphatase)